MNPRTIATKILTQVIFENRHLNDLLQELPSTPPTNLISELCYGVCRWYFRLDFFLQHLLSKKLKNKDNDIYCLLLLGLYQVIYLRIPNHAAVFETVDAADHLKKSWAKNMINAVLRNFLRQQDTLTPQADQNEIAFYSHPEWFIKKIKNAWPEHWQSILNANNEKASLCLRVNLQKNSREEYLQELKNKGLNAKPITITACGIELQESVTVEKLPGFSGGFVTIQDASAQCAAILLNPKTSDYVLDACAAPGGKTTHLFEVQPRMTDVVAIDMGQHRIRKLKETCERMKVAPKIIDADANVTAIWWDGTQFDRILLDAPCSATGVIRRHPDIKFHRAEEQIKQLTQQQLQLLESLWQVLKPGGFLLYVTCSILPEENQHVIKVFLEHHADAREIKIDAEWGIEQDIGRQILPTEHGDGFYYVMINKKEASRT